MKVIFLDNDGVICLPAQQGGRYKKQKKWGGRESGMTMNEIPIRYRFDNFDKKSIKVLNKILEESGAEIIVSSDWRKWATLEELGDYYESQGIIRRPIGLTEFINDEEWTKAGIIPADFPFHRYDMYEQIRYFEITKWLMDHPEVTHWVAIDDMSLGKIIYTTYSKNPVKRDWGLENFVHSNYYMGIQQSGLKDKIMKYLI